MLIDFLSMIPYLKFNQFYHFLEKHIQERKDLVLHRCKKYDSNNIR